MYSADLSKATTTTASNSLDGVVGVILVRRDSDPVSENHSCSTKTTISELVEEIQN